MKAMQPSQTKSAHMPATAPTTAPTAAAAVSAPSSKSKRRPPRSSSSSSSSSRARAAAMAAQPAIQSLHVIYDADGSITGELVYMAKKLLGIAHCAACDITHGPRAEKPEFTALKRTRWRVPVENIHRDEMDPHMAARVGNCLPCVAAVVRRGASGADDDEDYDYESESEFDEEEEEYEYGEGDESDAGKAENVGEGDGEFRQLEHQRQLQLEQQQLQLEAAQQQHQLNKQDQQERAQRDVVVVVQPSELERCNGALDCFERAVDDGARKLGLTLERGDVCA